MSEDKMVKGFNSGYLLARFSPELVQKLQAVYEDQSYDYAKGFMAGASQYQREKQKTKKRNYTLTKEHKDTLVKDNSKTNLSKNKTREDLEK